MNLLKQRAIQEILGKLIFIGFMIGLFIVVLSRSFTTFPEEQQALTKAGDDASIYTENIENYKGFKIVRYGDSYYALAIATPVDR